MGVLFLMPSWNAASEVWMQRMIEMLEPDVSLIGTYFPKETHWRGRIPTLNLKPSPDIISRNLFKLLRLNAAAAEVSKVKGAVKKKSVTAILVHYLPFALKYDEAWQATDKPLFVHCHGYDVTWDLRDYKNPTLNKYDDAYVSSVRRLSERAILIANSAFTRQNLIHAGIDPKRIVTKYFGVNVPESCVKSGHSDGQINILYLGRLVDFKGPDLVIQAFDLACQRGLNATLTIAGDGPLRITCELFKIRSAFRERITIIGEVLLEEGKQLRTKADIFVAHNCKGILTNQEEAFGVSIIEAMSESLPVITGRNGSIPELVESGKTGILIEPGDLNAQADAFLLLATNQDLRLSMGKAARERVVKLFSYGQEKKALRKILSL